MEKGEKITIRRKTFSFGGSKSAVTLPAGLNIVSGTEVNLTVEVVKKPE